MSTDDLREYYEAIKRGFNDEEEIERAILLSGYESLSISEITLIPELNQFFGGDEDNWAEFLNKGLRSLRTGGFYKICGEPFYNVNIFPHTFSAHVYYFHLDNDRLIKYQANIGPMTNSHSGYCALPATCDISKIAILQTFMNERRNEGNKEEYYYRPKKKFFDSIYSTGKIFYVIKSEFDPDFPDLNPRPKKVAWSFIDS
ncbi:MAG TPA: hypothetical protein VHS53_12180 [Mucilaginibacter sp.]|jgi:hypothetical protein|nr:hypothetical protein [Mucilaginibacter sp.]